MANTILVSTAAVATLMLYKTTIGTASVTVVHVRSRVDGTEYLVQDLPNKQQAADNLATLVLRMKKLIQYMENRYPADERTGLLKDRFNPEVISEGSNYDQNYTSYSVDKGQKIVFCLRDRNPENSLVDINTMTFVALHEMAHLCTNDANNSHSDIFWKNFKFILDLSQQPDLSIYVEQNFRRMPKEYCGMQISDSPAL